MTKLFVVLGLVFAVIGLPMLVGYIQGEFEIFWTIPGAALFQSYGIATVFWVMAGVCAYFERADR